MGLEIFVQWFADGQTASVPFADVLAPFESAVEQRGEDGFRVRYGPNDDSFVYARPDADGQLTHIMIERPCGALELWDGIVRVTQLGHALCYWPAEACAISHSEVVGHIPKDIAEGLPPTTVVENGAALIRLVESS